MIPSVRFFTLFGGLVALLSTAGGAVPLTDPTVADVAKNFLSPPSQYSSQVTWGWSGVITREVIARDLDKLLAMNLRQAWVEPGRNPEAPYLSPAYFENVKIAVEEAKKRGMHLWFDDDGGYPSGFAGGKISMERPDLAMKALAKPEEVAVAPGEVFRRAWDDRMICAVAQERSSTATELLEPKAGQLSWTAPTTGNWTIALVRWEFRSGVTKSSNNKSGTKDGEHSLMDYLSPEANRAFGEWTFEAYKRAVGDDFGKTFLGFRGDEASYNFNPWTPDFLAEFQRRKGYDLRPYLPAVATIEIGRRRANAAPVEATLTPAQRAYADYSDVWSDLFGENFFAHGAAWCAANGVEMQTHIEHEEILPQLAIANGDYFKCMRGMQIPGVDVIWHQLWHDVVADFPKLASSAAHLNGHPLSMSESFAAMSGRYPTPNLDEVGWILNHQIALGITHFEYMFMPASATRVVRPTSTAVSPPSPLPPAELVKGAAPAGYRYLQDPKFADLAQAVNRSTYVLAQGRPMAQIGVLVPSSSFWFGDTKTNQSFLAVVHALLGSQRDVDFVDDGALAKTLQVKDGALVNLSGQGYRAIIVPPVVSISHAALARLEEFAKVGGKVIFLGGLPQLVMERNFLTAAAPGKLHWASIRSTTDISEEVLAELPSPDLAVDRAAAGLKYNHRRLKNGDVYFLFNEGDVALRLNARVACGGVAKTAQQWNAQTGEMLPLSNVDFAKGHAALPVELEPWATTLLVIETE